VNLWDIIGASNRQPEPTPVRATRMRAPRQQQAAISPAELPMSIMPFEEVAPEQYEPVSSELPPGVELQKPQIPEPQEVPSRMPTVMPERGPASMRAPTPTQAPISDEQKALIDELIASQQQDVDAQNELVARAESMGTQMDLRPLAGLVDSWTGGKLASSMGTPFTEADKLKLVSALRDKALEGKEKISATRLKQALGEGNLDMKQLAMMMGVSRKVDSDAEKEEKFNFKVDKAALDYTKEMRMGLKELNKEILALDQANELAKLVQSGNTTAFSGLGVKMARAMGEVGVLTKEDVKNYVTSGKLTQGMADTLNKWINGSATEATMSEIGQIADVLTDSLHNKESRVKNSYVRKLAANFKRYGMTPEEAALRLDVNDYSDDRVVKAAKNQEQNANLAGEPDGTLDAEKRQKLLRLRAEKAKRQKGN
jgi:hypothetical protein